MAKIQIVKYQCDVCGAEFDKEEDLESTHIPCYGGERNDYNSEVEIDLCKDCAKNLREIIYKNFASINNWYGVQITNKQTGV